MRFFELSVASKYLSPRWRQLSVSIISLISMLVISLVVWLIVVFFSVTHGLEKNWVQKLIALTAPIRITPTQEYYQSYYYLIDSISSESDYSLKSFNEKFDTPSTDPYDPTYDEEIPSHWTAPDLNDKNELKDIVKLTYQAIEGIPSVTASDYEMTVGNIRLRLLRDIPNSNHPHMSQNQSFLNQTVYIGSFDPTNRSLKSAIVPIEPQDIKNLLNTTTIANDNIQEDSPHAVHRLSKEESSEKLLALLDSVEIKSLNLPPQGWRVAPESLPKNCQLEGCAVISQGKLSTIYIPQLSEKLPELKELLSIQGAQVTSTILTNLDGTPSFSIEGKNYPLSQKSHLLIVGEKPLPASLYSSSDLAFQVNIPVQKISLSEQVPLGAFSINQVTVKKHFSEEEDITPAWAYEKGDYYHLPSSEERGDSILLPKSYREAGVLLGDQGYLSYFSPTTSSVQEQRVPITVAGFYDPGIMPIGSKLVLTNKEIVSFIRGSQEQEENLLTNGINVRFDNLNRAEKIKYSLEKAFSEAGISKYWTVETYEEYDFARDILQQLKSEKNLFSLLAIVIMVVACSNIISMLIILVNDKKIEIGILRSMGASSFSIAAIFGLCGVMMGLIGSLIGIFLAVITLHNLTAIVNLLSRLQGHEMFNPAFYGETLPNEVSIEALAFVMIMTATISLIAGIVPAVKACLVRPSEILRAE